MLPYTTAQWLRFFRLIGRDDLAGDPQMADASQRSKRFQELYALIDKAMPERTTQEWVDALVENDILFGRVNSPEDLLTDPHLAALDMFPIVDHPSEGQLRLIGFPIGFSETPNQLYRLPPNLGQHTREVLAELGFADAELDRMQEQRVIVCN